MKGCRNCTNWQALGEFLEREDPATAGKKAEVGLCRRYAPRPTTRQGAGEEGSPAEGRWARVASDDWCGEWDPRLN